MSNFLRDQQLQNLNNKYLALYKTDPNYNNSGLEINKSSYVRQQIKIIKNIDGEYKNHDDVIFPTATENWGTISYLALFDAVTGGNMLWFGKVEIAQEVRSNEIFKIANGFLIFRVV